MRLSRPVSLKMAFRVSIHASVKDATRFRLSYVLMLIVSIHASVKDATCLFLRFLCVLYGFNPRICKRCDDNTFFVTKYRNSFNPRICKRCDLPISRVVVPRLVSIHASVKDATQLTKAQAEYTSVSIHASVKDATRTAAILNTRRFVSIHASVKDATDEDGRAFKVDFVSIHASVKDATERMKF